MFTGVYGSSISAWVADWKFMCRFFVRSQRMENSRFHRNCELKLSGSWLPPVLSRSRSCSS